MIPTVSSRNNARLAAQFTPLLLASASFLTTPAVSSAQDASALVDALVREGVLTEQKAENIRADLQRDLAQTSAGKIKLSNSVTELKLYGDLRLRYEYQNRDNQVANGLNDSQGSRYRFRLRINAEAKLGRDWSAGFSLGTGQPSDTEEQTFENGFDDYNLFITKAYLSWQPNDWLTVVGGKQKNPFYTTDLMWDPDITPTGLTETIALHKLPIFSGADGPTGAPEVKNSPSKQTASPLDVTFVAGQFIFDDNGEFNLDSDFATDAYLFVEQLIATYRFNKKTSLTVAPGFYTFTAADLSGLTNTAAFTDAGAIGATTSTRTTTSTVLTTVDTVNAAGTITTRVVTPTTVTSTATTVTNPDGTTTTSTGATTVRPGAPTTTLIRGAATPNQVTTSANTIADAGAASAATLVRGGLPAVSGETRQLHILTAPGDISLQLGGVKAKVYWDFAYNLGGRERFEDIYQLFNSQTQRFRYSERDGLAWLAGVQLGEMKKKGDWQINANYREVGIASIDPNLNDSTWALGRLNQRGFKLGLAYQIAEPVVFSVTGYLSWNLNEDIEGGRATNTPNVADSNAVQVLQVDLAVKF